MSVLARVVFAAGRLWRRIVGVYELREDELVLEHACHAADTIALLEAGMKGAPLLVSGSMGQQREHPLLPEARQQRGQLARLLAQLKLPDEDRLSSTSAKARKAAQARWARQSGGWRSGQVLRAPCSPPVGAFKPHSESARVTCPQQGGLAVVRMRNLGWGGSNG